MTHVGPSGAAAKVRIVVVDDSPGARASLRRMLEQHPALEVVGEASDAPSARALILELEPDVVTLDLALRAELDGIDLLEQLRGRRPTRIVVVSGHADARRAVAAYRLGAVAVVTKPAPGSKVEDFAAALRDAVLRAAAGAERARDPTPATGLPLRGPARCVLVLGASTGGPAAIRAVLAGLSAPLPPTLVALHLTAAVAGPFAASLSELGTFSSSVARDGDLLAPGHVLVSPGGVDVEVCGRPPALRVAVRPASGVATPSIDRLFCSLAERAGRHVVAAVLTGMGRDGAEGLLALRRAGAGTVAQDAATAVAAGMPRSALEAGGAERTATLQALPGVLRELLASHDAAPC